MPLLYQFYQGKQLLSCMMRLLNLWKSKWYKQCRGLVVLYFFVLFIFIFFSVCFAWFLCLFLSCLQANILIHTPFQSVAVMHQQVRLPTDNKHQRRRRRRKKKRCYDWSARVLLVSVVWSARVPCRLLWSLSRFLWSCCTQLLRTDRSSLTRSGEAPRSCRASEVSHSLNVTWTPAWRKSWGRLHKLTHHVKTVLITGLTN